MTLQNKDDLIFFTSRDLYFSSENWVFNTALRTIVLPNTKRSKLSFANVENQKQAPKQILVFNHRAFTKAFGLITEQWNVTSRSFGIVCGGVVSRGRGGDFHYISISTSICADLSRSTFSRLGNSIFLCR